MTWCKRSAQPGAGEGVRIEARRAKIRRAFGRGLVYESRFGEAEHAQRRGWVEVDAKASENAQSGL